MKNLIDKILRMRLIWILVFMASVHTAVAQDDYNPANPPEPVTPPPPVVIVKYNASVTITPADAGTVSGTGEYTEGQRVSVSTRNNTGFVFKHWLKDGTVYSTSKSFTYIMTASDVAFVAVYEYNPSLPQEPMDNYVEKIPEHPLWVKCYPEEACRFNFTSGDNIAAGTWKTITATANTGFVFQGWYDGNGTKISSSASFNYEMPNEEATLTARYVYDPTSPNDPAGGGQTDIDNTLTGDADGDRIVDVTDAVAIINAFLSGSTATVYDINKDGIVDVTDAVKAISIYLQTK